MPTFTGTEQANPNLDVDTFTPTGLDIDQWLDVCVAAGMTYAALTTKHHDGFALWPTAYHVDGYDPYSVAQTAWYAANGNPDIVDLFVTGCRSRGLNPVLYFSVLDTTYETRSGTDETTDAAGYLAMIEAQLTELLTNYGDISALWLDGYKWHLGYQEIPFETIYFFVKAIQPNMLLIDNDHTHPTFQSEIEIYEPGYLPDGYVPEGNTRLSEEVETIRDDKAWFKVSSDSFRSAASIKTAIAQANNRTATYLLGIQPGTDGALSSAQVAVLEAIPTA